MKPTIIVHGGAGAWNVSSVRLAEAITACEAAAVAGHAILASNLPALDAVEVAVNMLEDSPVLDAGRGSYPNTAGQIELDAIIMDGSSLSLGAIAAVRRILHPISLARRIMTDSVHNFLVGSGAEDFADSIGFPRCELSDLLVADDSQDRTEAAERDVMLSSKAVQFQDPSGNTVGAVALDSSGNLAAATSTGGTRNKLPGRVGDSPLVGSGAYADNWTAAVSATGHGEALMRVLISKRVCDFVAEGLSAQKACEAALDVLIERVSGLGGLIAVDARGRIGISHNTSAMPHAYVAGEAGVVSGK